MIAAELEMLFRDLNPHRREGVDGLKIGDPNQEIDGIVTTHLATIDVIYQAIDLSYNTIITYEPAFYSDDPETERDSSMYKLKRTLLDEHGIVLLRIHDAWENLEERGAVDSWAAQLGLGEPAASDEQHKVYAVPTQDLLDFAERVKEMMQLNILRVAGDLHKQISKVGLGVGRHGQLDDLKACMKLGADCFLTGECSEWQTVRYAVDANISVIVAGHTESENFGVQNMTRFLREKLPDQKVEFIDAGSVYSYI